MEGGNAIVRGDVIALQEQSDISANRRQGRAQLMRCIGDEASLGHQRCLEAMVGILELAQHLVETFLQPSHFVVGRVLRQAATQVLGSPDILGRARHGVEGS